MLSIGKTFRYKIQVSKITKASVIVPDGAYGRKGIHKLNFRSMEAALYSRRNNIMVVQHNMQAMNSNRMLGITTNAQAKSTEKLSSGYRINRAGDDAAGLSISEKMRSQIRGLNRASDNAQDGISAIQVAEGALNETHSILQRMNELATQAANDTNTTVDRDAIQAEIDALTSEIDRIRSTTQFNTQNLIDGNFQGKNLQIGALEGQGIVISISNMESSAIGVDSLDMGSFASACSAIT